MTRIALVVLLLVAGACRRKHVDEVYPSDPGPVAAPAASPTASAPAPSGTPGNPLHEPVLPPSDDHPRMPDGGTLNDDPRGPRPAEWKAIVDGAMPALQACFDRADLPPGEIAVTMHYTVELPGYTGAVTAKGNAPKEALDCCVGVVEGLKFPDYRGAKVERDLAFTWFKHETKVARKVDGGAKLP